MKTKIKLRRISLILFMMLTFPFLFNIIGESSGFTVMPVAHAATYKGNISLVTDKVSPQLANTKIKITANSNGARNLLYRFWIHDGYSWRIVRDYSTSNIYYWTPGKNSNYRVWVDVKDRYSKNNVDKYTEIYYTISNLNFKSIETDKSSPQFPNNSIKIRANVTGSKNLLYRFWIHDGYAWKVVQDYSSNNLYNWVPTKAGRYRIWIDTKDKYSKNDVELYKEINYSINTQSANISSITTDKASPQTVGNSIKVTANAGGSSNILYRFWIHDGSSWKVVQDYGSNKIYNWTPTKAGTYRIWIDVKDRYSGNGVDTWKEIYYKVNNVSANISSITTDKASPQLVGNTIKVTANAGGSSNILYRFWIHDGSSWKIVQDYGSNKIYNWNPTKAGTYRIWIDVKDRYSGNGVDTWKEIYYKVNNVSANISSITTDKASPQLVGNTIKVTANAGGSSNILYRFWIHDGSSWKVVQDYGSNKIYNWTPTKAGTYRIWIDVKDRYSGNGVDTWKEIYYKVNNVSANISSITTDKASPQAIGNTIKVTANAGGSSNMLYRFWIHDGAGWKVVQNYSTSNIYLWKPTKTGNHRVWIDVKDKNSSNDVDSWKEINFRIGGFKVFIDPGHGGHDPGATGPSGVHEKNISLSIAKKVKLELEKHNVEVLLSRSTDEYIWLYDRANMANQSLSDVFVSIHENAFSKTSVNGIETFYHSSNSEGGKLAGYIQNSLISNTQAYNKGVKTANFVVIRETKMPSVLVETGFLTNPSEDLKLQTQSYQNKVSVGIVSGILRYLGISK